MIVKKEFLNKLRYFGLNTYESKLWTALLSRGVSTAGELSDIADVPRSRAYDVLESLERKGFIVMKIGKPIKYLAVSPEEVLQRVKKKISDESDRQIKEIEKTKKNGILNELNVIHSQGISMVNPSELTTSLKGRDNIYTQLASMLRKAEKSIYLMTTEQGLLRKHKLLEKALTKAKSKGISIRIGVSNIKQSNDSIKKLSKIADIRHNSESARFCLVDSKEIIFMLLNDNKVHPSFDTAVWVDTPYFASTLKSIVDGHWQKLKSVK